MHYLHYNENKQHGTTDFPVAYYYVNEEHPRYSMPFHWHREWEIIRVLSGTFLLNIHGAEYHAEAGDVFLLPEGVLHGGTPRECIYECLNFDLEELCARTQPTRGSLRPFFRGRYLPRTRYCPDDTALYPVFEELLDAVARQSGEVCVLQTVGNLHRLFAAILAQEAYATDAPTATRTDTIDRLKPVLEYVESHFNQPLSLAGLAEIIGMNGKYFCRFFRQVTGQTPMNYVNIYRIEQAAHMLCATDTSVTEVGLECGFSDTSHFVKLFKKYKGITPKQFRKRER